MVKPKNCRMLKMELFFRRQMVTPVGNIIDILSRRGVRKERFNLTGAFEDSRFGSSRHGLSKFAATEFQSHQEAGQVAIATILDESESSADGCDGKQRQALPLHLLLAEPLRSITLHAQPQFPLRYTKAGDSHGGFGEILVQHRQLCQCREFLRE
jgi:hypothetical protein